MLSSEEMNFKYRKAALEAAVRIFSIVQATDVIKLTLGLEHYLRTGKNTQE